MLIPSEDKFIELFARRGLTPAEAYPFRYRTPIRRGLKFSISKDRTELYATLRPEYKHNSLLNSIRSAKGPHFGSAANLIIPSAIPTSLILPHCVSEKTANDIRSQAATHAALYYINPQYIAVYATCAVYYIPITSHPKITNAKALHKYQLSMYHHNNCIYITRVVDGSPNAQGEHEAYWLRTGRPGGGQIDSVIAATYGLEDYSLANPYTRT